MTETINYPYSGGSENSTGSKSAAVTDTPVKLETALIQVKEDDVVLQKGLIIVIPAYNEEVALGSVVLQARQFAEKVIVVDDGSVDNTAAVAKMAGAEVVSLEHNTGKAYALLLGLKRAKELGCKVAIMMDADGQHHARHIPRIAALALNGEADLVIGSRFIEQNGRVPAYRRVGQKTLDIATNFGAKQKVSDSQSGFRALSRKALDYLDFKSDGYNVESDMIAHFTANGLVLKEVPIDIRYDVPNKHKKHPLTHGMGVLSRLINMISYRRPLLAFGIPGVALIVGGMATEIWVFSELSTGGVFHDVLAIGSGFVLVLGMLLLIAGLILNTLVIIVKEHNV
jgi:glycosyltransferase involved in cell wall biosynthesis